jgi:hypothetical protein
MRYIPSPIPLKFEFIYAATANSSGRMQYYRIKPGFSKARISRTEFIKAYNETSIIAINPLQRRGEENVFQFEFYV